MELGDSFKTLALTNCRNLQMISEKKTKVNIPTKIRLSLHCCGWCPTPSLLGKEICQAVFSALLNVALTDITPCDLKKILRGDMRIKYYSLLFFRF